MRNIIFHCGIVAYLGLILLGCGYKAAPFYELSKQEASDSKQDSTQEANHTQSTPKKKVIFHGIDSHPTIESEE